jgi:predicted dehydrogenase
MKKLAVVGCGGIGEYHLEHFLAYDDVELVGFCDIIRERGEAFVQKAGRGQAFECFRTMYDAVKPDMVFICVPPYCHGEIELETINRGIHMFVEKPVTLDIALAEQIRDAAAKKGVITASGFQCRYSNLIPATRAFVDNNEIIYVGCERMGGLPDVHWWRVKALSGGQIVEQTVHQFDMIRYIMGEVAEVSSFAARGFVRDIPGYDTDDVSVTALRFASGALGCVSTGCYALTGAAYDSKITFSAKDARLDHYIIEKVRVYGNYSNEPETDGLIFSGDGTMRFGGGAVQELSDDGNAGKLCDRTFVDAVLTGDASNIRSPYADAVKTLALTLACNRSISEGKPVQLPV